MAGILLFPNAGKYIEIDNILFAITKKEQENGLMGKTGAHFMAFINKDPKPTYFWMKNTPMHLDILYCNERGNVIDLAHGFPNDEKIIKSSSHPKFVIEAPYGFCAGNNMSIGSYIKIKYDEQLIKRIIKAWGK